MCQGCLHRDEETDMDFIQAPLDPPDDDYLYDPSYYAEESDQEPPDSYYERALPPPPPVALPERRVPESIVLGADDDLPF